MGNDILRPITLSTSSFSTLSFSTLSFSTLSFSTLSFSTLSFLASAIAIGALPTRAAGQAYVEPRELLGAEELELAELDDGALRIEVISYRLERGFGTAAISIGAAAVLFGAITAGIAADPPCLSLWGSCTPGDPDPQWIAGGALIAAAGVGLVIAGGLLVEAGGRRRERVERERTRRGLAGSGPRLTGLGLALDPRSAGASASIEF
jgi:hypothetical protein